MSKQTVDRIRGLADKEIVIPKGQKERKLSPSRFVFVRYYGTIEKVSNFEIAVAKLKETLQNVKFATLCRSVA